MATAAAPTIAAFCSGYWRRPYSLLSPSSIALNQRITSLHASVSPALTGLRHPFCAWCGVKHLGVSSRLDSRCKGRKERCRGLVVHASLFGVGAPEALVIGVVALLVFGPKGLAEVARNLGRTLRSFQPTIRELQEVSKEFKSTLEREIGLDEVASSNSYRPTSSYGKENQQTAVDPNGATTTKPYSGEELQKITAEQLAAVAAQLQETPSSSEERPQAHRASEVAASPTPSEIAGTPAREATTQEPLAEKNEK